MVSRRARVVDYALVVLLLCLSAEVALRVWSSLEKRLVSRKILKAHRSWDRAASLSASGLQTQAGPRVTSRSSTP